MAPPWEIAKPRRTRRLPGGLTGNALVTALISAIVSGVMDALLKQARRENRGLTAAELGSFDRLETEFMAAVHEGRGKPRGYMETRGTGDGGRTPDDNAFSHYLRTGDFSRLNEVRADAGWTTAPNEAGLSAGNVTSGAGGYLVPQGFWENLQVALKAYSGTANDFRRVETPTGTPMPWPTVDPQGHGKVLN